MSTIRTTLNLNTHARNGTEYEVEIEVAYAFHRGFKMTRTDPAEPDSIEITGIEVVEPNRLRWSAGWLTDLLADDAELHALCLQDAAERRADAEEARAELQAEYLAEMKGGF